MTGMHTWALLQLKADSLCLSLHSTAWDLLQARALTWHEHLYAGTETWVKKNTLMKVLALLSDGRASRQTHSRRKMPTRAPLQRSPGGNTWETLRQKYDSHSCLRYAHTHPAICLLVPVIWLITVMVLLAVCFCLVTHCHLNSVILPVETVTLEIQHSDTAMRNRESVAA